ncbi:MAG TPA: Mrp/NBP35 family ATP-binding protein [Thermoanaerobaculia bacterium]|jgi:ATP-binding protein involved in chromosome partitioning|nr:Mrp/NBP35 family ATP-binding protein [Thermoanaerobaculia bacterium]
MSTTAALTEEKVLETLRSVRFPGLSRDIVSFGFVKDLTVGGGNVSLRLEITTESSSAAEEIRRDATEKLRSLEGVHAVTIRLDVRPPAAAAARTPAAAAPSAILPEVRFTIAVASGKGGVGKSTVAANLALALERVGRRVGLMDSDIYGPSQQMMMGIDEKPYVNEANQIVPVERYGVRVMSLGFLMDVDQPVIWRGPMVMKAVEQFLQDVAWGPLDYLVIDLPPGTGDAQLTLTQKIHLSGAVIVTTPQDVSLIDARKGLAMFQKVNVPVLGIIENMSYYVCPSCGHREEIFKHGGGRRTAESLQVPFLGEIPLDPKVVAGGDSGRPIVAADPRSAVSEAYLSIAEGIARRLEDAR